MQKLRWSRVYESSEEELTALLKTRNIKARRIRADADSEAVAYTAPKDSTLWCAEGSLVVRTGSTDTPLQPGDAVRVEANTDCELRVGISGYVCYVSS